MLGPLAPGSKARESTIPRPSDRARPLKDRQLPLADEPGDFLPECLIDYLPETGHIIADKGQHFRYVWVGAVIE
jgi:hypothetical protein